ncbi:MAG: hypothetical protein OEZ16_02095 [Chromatiales bacterium]|nr:hypothetical protein [Chromatiales bacterium]
MNSSTRDVMMAGLLGVFVTAGAQAMGEESMADMSLQTPPPGPYVSSRPNINPSSTPQQERANRLPFVGNMPTPTMPMRYMPSPDQYVPPPPWWGKPNWRR